jgi:predicted 3-demethylubiquinone-9 3-methyltransferase (glyoxalase superfamily)
MNKPLYPCLWFDGQAKEAAELYCSVFKDTKITSDNQMVVIVESSGQKLMLLNGGPEYKINPSISFFVVCENVKELDNSWNKLIEGGTVMMPLDNYPWSKKYGWIQDRFGVNWQLSFAEPAVTGQKITPALMFTENQFGNAEEAINFYVSLFEGSGVDLISRYTKDDNDVEGAVNHFVTGYLWQWIVPLCINSVLMKVSLWLLNVTARLRSIISGTILPGKAKRVSVAGLKINMEFHGKLYHQSLMN